MTRNGLRAQQATEQRSQLSAGRHGSDVACRRCTAGVPIHRAAKQQGYCDSCVAILTGKSPLRTA